MSSFLGSQYRILDESAEIHGGRIMGSMANATWNLDPKRLTFTLSRYKFAAKMLEGKENVLEVGCGDGFASRIVAQHVKHLTVSDFDPRFVAEASGQGTDVWRIHAIQLDPLKNVPLLRSNTKRVTEATIGSWDGIYLLDVLEHIPPSQEVAFIRNLTEGLDNEGVLIIGMPSLESQPFASPASKEGHVNCKTSEELRSLMHQFFSNVFMFSMNDEVVHTGFARMANYIIAVCAGKRAD